MRSTDLPTAAPVAGVRPGWLQVQQAWARDGQLEPQSLERFTELGERFVTRLERAGVTDWAQVGPKECSSFIRAPRRGGGEPAVSTQRLRRSAVRAIFRQLRRQGVPVGDPTLDLEAPPRRDRASRPLTDAEIELGRVASRLGGGSRTLLRAVAWALAEAGAATSEIGAVRIGDLDDPTTPRAVTFPESTRFAARTVPLTAWGQVLLTRHLQRATKQPGDVPLAYAGAGGSRYLAQASVAAGLTRVLDLAGLRADPLVHARSVRAWAGRRMYDAGAPLEIVAQALGHRSLDGAAREIVLRRSSK